MHRVLAVAGLFFVAACSIPEPQLAVDRDTLTQRQKDSIASTLPLPGASGIGRALRASDAAKARAEHHDALGANP
jgi:hypothetical protein